MGQSCRWNLYRPFAVFTTVPSPIPTESPSVPSRQRVGILGGTFNPPHFGHLQLAQCAQQQAGLDRVLWVPSDRSPHKADPSIPSLAHRSAMVDAAIAPYPTFQRVLPCSPQALSYGVDTFNALTQHYPAQSWFWIVGLDTFQTLPRWYRLEDFVARCQWLVAPRPLNADRPISASAGSSRDSAVAIANTIEQAIQSQGRSLNWTMLQMSPVPISSTHLRPLFQHSSKQQSLQSDASSAQNLTNWLPSSVIHYIKEHQLYG